jgi:hypothetical protein
MLAHLAPGDDPQFPDPQAVVEALLPAIDLDREWWLARLLADIASVHDDSERAIARLVDVAARVRAPRLMIAAEVSRGAAAAVRTGDFDVTVGHVSRALDIAIASNDAVAEAECRRLVALAIVGLGRDDALDACRDALVHVYAVRYWLRIWQLFGSLGLAWADRGLLEPASVVLGAAERRIPDWGLEYELGFRARTRDIASADPRFAEWTANGADMDRHVLVDYALGTLDLTAR